MFLATLVMVAGVTLTNLSSSFGSGSAPSFSISCFSIRTPRSWHFMKGTEVEALSGSGGGSSSSPRGWGISGKMTEAYKLSLLKVLIA